MYINTFSPEQQGTLAGYDQKSNVVLSNCVERVYSMDEGVEEVPLGLYLVKGDMMYVTVFSDRTPAYFTLCVAPLKCPHRGNRRREGPSH